MNKRVVILLIGLLLLGTIMSVQSQTNDDNIVQIAILLDTSSSMDGLINQAKSQLWKIVNELTLSKKNGKAPKIEVALYEYGKSTISSNKGFINQIVPLSNDLDKISDELFKLTTNGGDEYCGQVIKEAVNNLNWNKSSNILKLIFIAGNEPFTQGKVDYKDSCKAAITKGIIVNTIFCGDFNEGVNTNWKNGADIADGAYMNIDQNIQTAYIEAPQDNEIAKLGEQLNKTYLAFGQEGEEKKELQSTQDSNANSMSKETAVQRSITKSSTNYNNSTWDLVDAIKDKKVDISKIKKEELPKEMQSMTDAEKNDYISKKIKEREEIQKKIITLNEERRLYLEKKMKENTDANSLDTVIIKTIKNQAVKKNFKF